MNTAALNSLMDIDKKYPTPLVLDFLARPDNQAFLDYVYKDPFGCHVFPGDIIDYHEASFIRDMAMHINEVGKIHLWVYIPTCRYRCHFCQFPTLILNPDTDASKSVFQDIVDLNIQEAQMWLRKIPTLSEVEVVEFNVFGGTPSLLPEIELRRMMAFYKNNFNFTSATLRFEGEPGTLNKAYLSLLKELGFSKISFGVQSFNNKIIANCGRRHTAEEAKETILQARNQGIDWTSIDLIYGMAGQTVDDVKYDMEQVLELNLSHVVCTKLHLDEFLRKRTGVSGERASLWQKKEISHLPGLGKQYQMREVIEHYHSKHYTEHPTMYFHRNDQPAEKWKGLITDLDKQFPEIAIGLGGSSKCMNAESINTTNFKNYKSLVMDWCLPVGEIRGISASQREINAFKMALSTLIPVDDKTFKKRFAGKSFFENEVINYAISTMVQKELATLSDNVVTLTPVGITLVEAIINTQFIPFHSKDYKNERF